VVSVGGVKNANGGLIRVDKTHLQTGARPIFDKEVYDYVREVSADCWNEPTTIMTFADIDLFKNLYKNQLNEYKHSNVLGLDKFACTGVIDGVTGAFMDWYAYYTIANLVVLKGEYPFHARNGCTVLEHFSDIKKGQTLILSTPFSATGNIHEDYYSIIEHCNNNKVDVLLDCAYLNISNIGDVNINEPCIKSVATSLSKVFATGMNKIGMKFDKEEIQTPVKQLNDWYYLNHFSMNLHIKLMNKFNLSFIYNKYIQQSKEVCTFFGIDTSNTLLFGLSKNDNWKEFSRDGLCNRICISKILSE